MVERKARALDWALDQLTGSLAADLALIHMARRGNISHECYMSHERLARETGCSLRTLGRAIRHLKLWRYIEEIQQPDHRRRTRRYRLCVSHPSVGHIDWIERPNGGPSTSQNGRQNLQESKSNRDWVETPRRLRRRPRREAVQIGQLIRIISD